MRFFLIGSNRHDSKAQHLIKLLVYEILSKIVFVTEKFNFLDPKNTTHFPKQLNKIYVSFSLYIQKGEFLDPKNPTHSTKKPPSFDTITASNKMAYVWVTDFTLNSVGDVFHKTGLLKKLIGPITKEVW